jgi:hypothetical protein
MDRVAFSIKSSHKPFFPLFKALFRCAPFSRWQNLHFLPLLVAVLIPVHCSLVTVRGGFRFLVIPHIQKGEGSQRLPVPVG